MQKEQYSTYYQRIGNRIPAHVQKCRIFNISNLKLSKQAALQYYSDIGVGPDPENELLKGVTQRIPLYSYTDIETHYGQMTKRAFNHQSELMNFIKKERKFVLVKDLKNITPNPVIPIVTNYSLIDKQYKYLGKELDIHYNKALNELETIVRGFIEVHEKLNGYYNQFILINIPEHLMSVSKMKAATDKITLEHLKYLNNLDALFVFEFWKWVGVRREKSIFNKLYQEVLDKINVAFICNNTFTLFNLGLLNKFRRSNEFPKGSIEPSMLSKLMLKNFISLKLSSKDDSLIELTEEEKLEKNDQKDILAEDNEDIISNLKEVNGKTSEPEVYKEENEDKDIVEEDEEKIDFTNKDSEVTVDEDIDLVSDIIDEEDDLNEDNSILASSYTKTKGITIDSEEGEQSPEFNEVISKIDSEDALGIKKIKIEDIPTLIKVKDAPTSPDEKARLALDEYAKNNPMTVSKHESLKKQLNDYKSIIMDDSGKTLDKIIDVKKEDVAITEEDYKENASTLNIMDKKYINQVLDRDIASMLVGVQSGGCIVKDIKKTEIENIAGGYNIYSMKIKPIEGMPSTIRVKLPKLDEDGSFKVGGQAYRFKKQRADLPIRKIDSDTVSLTSYFGKTFIRRDDARVNNYAKWLVTNIRKAAFDENNKKVLETRSNNVFDNLLESPNVFGILSKEYRAITTDECYLYFDYNKASERFNPEVVEICKKNNLLFTGIYKKQLPIGVNMNDEFFYIDKEGVHPLGVIEDICGLSQSKRPIETCTIDIMGKKVPIVIVLAYKLGLTKLISALKPKYYRTVITGKRLNLLDHEYAIKFSDFTIVLSYKDRLASLILSGLIKCTGTEEISIYQLDSPDAYFTLLESIKIPGRYVKEFNLYYTMFIDPITERILIDMNEPTDFSGLLVRAVELLETQYHKDEVDMTEQRIRGFERFAGEVYTQLVRAMREHNRHGIKANYPVELNPEAVWMGIIKDTTKQTEETLNPIQDLKQQEIVTFTGNGGRSKQSMVKRTRKHHLSATGIVSEASVDNSQSGVTTYLSSNPRFSSLYGIPENSGTDKQIDKLQPENVFSTLAMMSPCMDTDDAKRILLAGPQIGSTISSSNYRILPTRTGYDEKLVERCSANFAQVASQDGIVTKVDKFGITIKYKDGTTKSVELGTRYGNSGGFTTPLEMITDLKEGDKIKSGGYIAYNPGFFTPDPMNPGKLGYKFGGLAKVALLENNYTYEDSTGVSMDFCKKSVNCPLKSGIPKAES